MLNALSSVNISAVSYASKVHNNNKVKINAINAEVYRSITAFLNNKGIQKHTFEDK
jgi:hypothetical protein